MSRPDRPVDKFGFPIPVTFNEPPAPRKGFRLPESPHSRRAIGILVGLVIAGVLVGPWLVHKTRIIMAQMYHNRARDEFYAEDYSAALENIDRAIAWLPGDMNLVLERAGMRLANHDLDGALADANTVLAESKDSAPAYAMRSTIRHRRGEDHEAIQDATAAINNSSGLESQPWNHRAYYRALAGVELDEALKDIQHGLDLLAQQDATEGPRLRLYGPLVYRLVIGRQRAAFLDTRGFVLFKLGKHADALADFDAAIKECVDDQQALEQSQEKVSDASKLKEVQRQIESLNTDMAVMYHHRGEAKKALGNEQGAKNDLEVAQKFGYDPDKGVE